ncbi:MAG: hypothetical protein UR61_C0024G0005 [candidate division WS6 bacterium GW2011_GWE1_34_7]|uniref:Uncharacterized protein n=1 Tax=candidate division WS6 bacterium GW2011_GWE1_34_7 TaxID=1619093 RepID=A0A0G0DQU5_9BACT|nr:MAG: hypothetical protein UR61_C0024G0005 [candidate division WS6 bacterium GW2011_GWE1_34_7]
MSKNPFYNAFAAILYIVAVVFTVNLIDELETNEGLGQYVMPILVISILTLSVAVMGYIFFFQPLKLFLDGKKEQAISFFLKTVGTFAIIIFCIIIGYSLLII